MFLVCSRAEAPLMTRGAKFNRFCGTCGSRVMIAPTSQRLLEKSFAERIAIICEPCFAADVGNRPDNIYAVAGHLAEVRAEFNDRVPNTWRTRN